MDCNAVSMACVDGNLLHSSVQIKHQIDVHEQMQNEEREKIVADKRNWKKLNKLCVSCTN